MKRAILRYIVENWDDLLALDLKLARIFGAPAPHTISSYSHVKWKWLEPIIDALAIWLWSEFDHCYNDYKRVSGSVGASATASSPRT
jgi:hypothetical protein